MGSVKSLSWLKSTEMRNRGGGAFGGLRARGGARLQVRRAYRRASEMSAPAVAGQGPSQMLGLRQPEVMKKCNWHKKVVPLSAFGVNPKTGRPYFICLECRAKSAVAQTKYMKTKKGKATAKQYEQSEKRKSYIERYNQLGKHKSTNQKYAQSEKGKAVAKRYRQSEKGKANNKANNKRYDRSEKGNVARRFRNSRPVHRIRVKICHMLRNSDVVSKTVMRYTGIASNADLVKHFESTFDKAWMTWQNHGSHKAGNGYCTAWNIGHNIPCAAYDYTNPIDLGRCFSIGNMRAEDAKENVESGAALPPDDWLLKHRQLWPQAWKDILPSKEWRAAFYKAHSGRDKRSGSSSNSAAYTSEAEDLEAASVESDSAEDSSAEEDSDLEEEDLASGSAAASSAAEATAEAFRAVWAMAAEDSDSEE